MSSPAIPALQFHHGSKPNSLQHGICRDWIAVCIIQQQDCNVASARHTCISACVHVRAHWNFEAAIHKQLCVALYAGVLLVLAWWLKYISP